MPSVTTFTIHLRHILFIVHFTTLMIGFIRNLSVIASDRSKVRIQLRDADASLCFDSLPTALQWRGSNPAAICGYFSVLLSYFDRLHAPQAHTTFAAKLGLPFAIQASRG